jgi:hypothetical protein
MARVLWALSIRGTPFCDRNTEKGTEKMVATKTYLMGLAKGWTVILDLQSYDQHMKAVLFTNLCRCTTVDICVTSPYYVYEGH